MPGLPRGTARPYVAGLCPLPCPTPCQVYLDGCSFNRNAGNTSGGAVWLDQSTLVVQQTSFSGNVARGERERANDQWWAPGMGPNRSSEVTAPGAVLCLLYGPEATGDAWARGDGAQAQGQRMAYRFFPYS